MRKVVPLTVLLGDRVTGEMSVEVQPAVHFVKLVIPVKTSVEVELKDLPLIITLGQGVPDATMKLVSGALPILKSSVIILTQGIIILPDIGMIQVLILKHPLYVNLV